MSGSKFAIIIFVFLSAVLVFLAVINMYNPSLITFNNQQVVPTKAVVTNTPSEPKPPKIVSENYPVVPIRVSHPALQWATVGYGMSGTITELKTVAGGMEIVTSINGVGVPSFVVTPKTKIYTVSKNAKTEGTTASLKVGQKVTIAFTYNLKTKVWATNQVEITSSTPSSPQPTQ